MNAAKVVPSEVQTQCGMKIGPLFGKCVRQAREPANLHSHGEVLSFDMRRANSAEFWSSPLWDRDSVHDIGGRVAVFSVARRSVDLHQLGKVNARPKAVVNSVHIGLESIRRNLEVPLSGFIDLLGKDYGVARRSASKMLSKDQLVTAFDCDEAIGVSTKRITAGVVFLFAAHEAPQFVTLNIGDGDAVNPILQKPFALLPSKSKQRKNCRMVKPSDALRCANRASFTEKFNRLRSLFDGRVHVAKRSGVILGKCLVALIAAVALKAVSMLSEFLAAGIAVVTGHYEPCLSSAIGSQWSLERSLRAIALSLAPSSVPADGGAFYLSSVKSKRSAFGASDNFSPIGQPLENRIYECQRILDALEIIAPGRKGIPNFYGAQASSQRAIKHSADKISPRYFSPYFLAKSVLKPNLSGLQLSDFGIKLRSLLQLAGDLPLYVFQSFLQFLGHCSPPQYPSNIHMWSIYVKHYFRAV